MSAVTRPLAERHQPIRFVTDDGSVGQTAVPINYDEVYVLKGRLLTLVDATYVDPVQRKAQKDIVWQALRTWMDELEARAEFRAGWVNPAVDGPPSGAEE